jgi:MFS family permease
VVGLAQAACCVVMAYAQSTPVLVGMVAVIAAGTSVTQPTFAALMPDMVRRDDLPRATATMQTASSVGMLVGPPVAGLLVGAFGLRLPLLLDGVTFLGITLAGLLIATRRRPSAVVTTGEAAAGEAVAGEAVAGAPATAWSLWRDPLLMPIIVMTGLVIAVVSGINVVDVFFVRETLGASTTMYGVIGATWTGALVIGSWLVARRRTDDAGYAVLMAGSLALTCAAIAIVGLVPNVGWMVPLFVAGGIGNGATNSIIGVLMARRAPSAVRGRAFGYLGAVASAANIAGFVAGGLLVGRFEPAALLVASGALGVLTVVACTLPMLRAARRERVRLVNAAEPVEAPGPPATTAA